MAKSRPTGRSAAGASKKKRPRRKPSRRGDLRRALWTLIIVLAVVLAGAITVRVLVPPSAPPPTAPAVRSRPPASPPAPRAAAPTPAEPARKVHPVPAYEIFPHREVPPTPVAPAPKPSHRPQVALVIDDLGYDLKLAEGFLSLDIPLTVAVIPFSPFKDQILVAARRHRQTVMLHMPMEPEEYPAVNPGRGALMADMTPDQLIGGLRAALADVPGAVGVNNHMGSRLTRDADRMNQIFSVLKQRGLFFIDSRTTSETRSYQAARLLKVPFAERDVFLDHLQDPAAIRRQFDKLVRRAEQQGRAVGIGHPHPVTLEVLRQRLPELRRQVDLVPAGRVVRTLS